MGVPKMIGSSHHGGCSWFGRAAPLVIILALAPPPAFPAGKDTTPSPKEIITKAEEARNPNLNYSCDLEITENRKGRGPSVFTFRIWVQDGDKTLGYWLTPDRFGGRILLMRGPDVWLHMPGIASPLRVSLRQGMSGVVAYGDLARTRFPENYTATLLKTEGCGERTCNLLELTAGTRGVTYHRILYWVDRERLYPVKAEFYGFTDKLLKTATYGDFRKVLGRTIAHHLELEDSVFTGYHSTLKYSNFREETLPEELFGPASLGKLDLSAHLPE